MRSKFLYSVGLLGLATVLSSAGCGPHYYRGYDPYYGDYHTWGPAENGYYGRWENETHRPHREFRDRPANEQRDYYNWRHNQGQNHGDHHGSGGRPPSGKVRREISVSC